MSGDVKIPHLEDLQQMHVSTPLFSSTHPSAVMIELLARVQQMSGAELVSGKQTAFALLVLARFHFDVEGKAALIADALKRAVQSVKNSLDRDRRHVQKDARVFDEVSVRMLGPTAQVLLWGRIFKHQQQETGEEKHWDIQPLHDTSRGKLQNLVELNYVFVTTG